MTHLSRLAFIGNSLPRRCGIATFTTNLQQAISTSGADMETAIVAMTDHGHAYDYPSVVRLQVNDDRIKDYAHAADVELTAFESAVTDWERFRGFERL